MLAHPRQHHVPRADAERVIALALLVVRAGAKDSLDWWDDEALTRAGRFVLARIFPRAPGQAAVRLALRAARERHAGVLAAAGVASATTLVDLAEPLLHGVDAADLVSAEPVASEEEFRGRLVALVPEAVSLGLPQPTASGLLDLTHLVAPAGPSLLDRAIVLGAGYLAGRKREPVFPFVRLDEADRW